MSSNLYIATQVPLRHGPGPEEASVSLEALPQRPVERGSSNQIIGSPNQEIKARSTHGKHRHSSHGHKSHHGDKKHRKRHHHHKSSSNNKDKSLEYTPVNSPPSSGNHHRRSVPKETMKKLSDDDPKHRRRHSSSKEGNPAYYPGEPTRTTKRHSTEKKKNALSKSLPPDHPSIQVPMSRDQRIDTTFRGSLPTHMPSTAPVSAPPVLEAVEETASPSRGGRYQDEPMYPGAYPSGSEYSSSYESSEEEERIADQAMSNMENGDLITAYVVPNSEEENTPVMQQPRPAPPPVAPQSQVMEASHQTNETKQSLNITIPQATATPARTPTTSTTVQANQGECCGKGCIITGIVIFSLLGTACIVFFFIVPLLGWYLLVPGIVFLIVSFIFCCLFCSRSGGNTSVTTFISQ